MALSLAAEFDDVMRISRVFMKEPCEPDILLFVRKMEGVFRESLQAKNECQRLMKALQESNRQMSDLERKLNGARQLVDDEKRKRKTAELKFEELEAQMTRVRELVWNESANYRTKIPDEAWTRLASVCSQSEIGARGSNKWRSAFRPSLSVVLDSDEVSRNQTLDSTGSLLSELGYSQSEDDESRVKIRRLSGMDAGPSTKRRRSGCSNHPCNQPHDVQVMTMESHDGLRATTTVTVSREGPISAKAKFEALSSQDIKDGRFQFATGPPHPPAGPLQPVAGTPQRHAETPRRPVTTPAKTHPVKVPTSESEESLLVNQENRCPSPKPFNSGLNLMARDRLNGKPHTFTQKSIIKADTCDPCGKRINFGKVAAKCKDCHALVHTQCKDILPLPCIPVSGTPTSKGGMGVISDFTPAQAPMVPALLIHCINEVEARGLNEVGIYRIPGSERDVKALKERFLKQKGAPDLSRVDIHVICGCIKDFLRSLREPLVSPSKWSEFIRCVEPVDELDQQSRLYQVMADLPRPNRDTLAYLILHLQRVSASPACKMPAGNLAKVFGPTLVGYSTANPSPEAMMEETIKQVAVVQLMMRAPSSYWSCFVNSGTDQFFTPETSGMQSRNPSSSSLQKPGFLNTPLSSKSFKNRPKFFAPL